MLQCVCRGRAIKIRSILRVRQAIRSVVLQAHAFADLLYDAPATIGEVAFGDNPLIKLGQAERGRVFAKLARVIDAGRYPTSTITDPVSTPCTNGFQRGLYRSEYDWCRDGLRIECKSSQLQWDASRRSWKFHFYAIKFARRGGREVASFDELLLVFFTPRKLYFYAHDGSLGVSSKGQRTLKDGHQVNFRGPSGEEDWERACDRILRRLDCDSNACSRLAVMECTDPRVVEVLQSEGPSVTRRIYADSPLSGMSGPQRGLRIEALTRRVDALVHPGSLIADPEACSDRPNPRVQYDWKRDGRRIECKSSQMHWVRTAGQWKFSFAGIKHHHAPIGSGTSCFDELLLSLYTPQGIYVYRHDLDFGMSSRGNSTAWSGHQVQLYAPMRMHHWQTALEVLLSKLGSSCQRIAWVQW